MNQIRPRRWRMAAVAVAALILAPGAALAATRQQALPAAAPKCPTSHLMIWLGIPGEGAAGSISYQLELSNISRRTCTLFGFPGASAVALNGAQLGSPAARDHSKPTRLVTLSPGATAHVIVRIIAAGIFPAAKCHPTNAIGLKVYPPNDTTATVVFFGFRACARSGPVFLTVTTTEAGTGIPAFST